MAVSPTRRIQFADGLQRAWHCHYLPADQFHEQQRALFGRREFQRFEILDSTQLVKPYFDRDRYSHEEPTEQQLLAEQDECRLRICQHFPEDQVLLATRHGWVPAKAMHKISVRVYVLGHKIELSDMGKLLPAFNADAPFWDSGECCDWVNYGAQHLASSEAISFSYSPQWLVDRTVFG